MASEIAKAYVQIVPSAEGISGSISNVLNPEAEKAGASAGSKLSGAFGTAAKVGAASVAVIGTAIVASGKALVSAAGDVAVYGDNIDKMSQKLGISAEAYQEWDFIAQHSGTSMESLKTSFKTLATQAQSGSAEFEKLGISLEDASSMSTEDLFSAVISGLQGMEEGTERTAIASKLLGKGAVELGALLNTSAADTEAMRNQVHELGGVLSNEAVKAAAAYQDSLQNMQVSMDGLKNNMMATFLPSITSMMDGIAQIVSGDDSGLALVSQGITDFIDNIISMAPKLIEVGATLLTTLATAIIDNLPTLLESAVPIIMSIAEGIVQNLPKILEVGLQVILQIAMGIAQALPTMIPQIVEVVLTIVDTLIQNVDLLIDGAIALITGLAEGIINSLPILIEKAPEIIIKLIAALIENAPKLLQASVKLVGELAKGLISSIGSLLTAAGQLVMRLVNAIKAKATEFLSIGKNIVEGIKKGISSAWNNMVSWFKGLFGDLIGIAKKILGIASPSKEFAWIGEMVTAGFDKGTDGLGESAVENVQTAVDTLHTMGNEAIGLDMAVNANLTDANATLMQSQYESPSGRVDDMYNMLSELIPGIGNNMSVNVSLEGDAGRLFSVMRKQNDVFRKSNGASAFA